MTALQSISIATDGKTAILVWAAPFGGWTAPFFIQSDRLPVFMVEQDGLMYMVPASIAKPASVIGGGALQGVVLLDTRALPGGLVYEDDLVTADVPLGTYRDSSITITPSLISGYETGSSSNAVVTNNSTQTDPAAAPSGNAFGDLRRLWWSPVGVPVTAGGTQVATGRVAQARIGRGIVRSVGDREVLA